MVNRGQESVEDGDAPKKVSRECCYGFKFFLGYLTLSSDTEKG